jgi:hypothetical protein
MATFADFELLSAQQSYGGVEVMRGRRVLDNALGPPVDLALFGTARTGRGMATSTRVLRAASASAAATHEQVARIVEVGVYDDVLYAAAEAVDGVEVQHLVEAGRSEPALCLAIALELAGLAHELHEKSDVWDDVSGAAGIAALFPAGLRLDAIVIRRDGSIAVRPLAGAAADPRAPSAFRPPELARQRPTAASDVFVTAQVLRALLSKDASATSPPRLTGPAAALGGVLAAGLAPSPDDRLGLFMLVERLTKAFDEAAGGPRPRPFLAAAIAEQVADGSDGPVSSSSSSSIAALRRQLASVRARLEVRFPKRGETNTMPEAAPTAVLPRGLLHEGTSEAAVDRVFTDESDDLLFDGDDSVTTPGRSRLPKPGSTGSAETIALSQPPLAPPPAAAPVLDIAAASFGDEGTTQTVQKAGLRERTAESDPPWLSISADVEIVSDVVSEAVGAPPPLASEIEAGPTVEMKSPFDPADSDEDTQG